VSRDNIVAFLQRTGHDLSESGVPLRVKRGRVEFRNVRLNGALRGVNAVAQPRQLIAITGPNGSGKSALLSVVARLADPDKGRVLVDGQALQKCTIRSCAAHISIVSAALPLMRGTLRRNLLYRWRDAPEAELQRVIDLCGVADVIAQLPGGLDGTVYEGGVNLSQGHAARVALARAMVRKPKVLLLDEPTNGLDEQARRHFRATLAGYAGTVLMVTHDPDELAMADQVWRMEHGKVVAVQDGEARRARATDPDATPGLIPSEVST
jgi:ABC-type multidrug transport system fused ATPase/permease subunit